MHRIQCTSVLFRVRINSDKSAEKRCPTEEKVPAPLRVFAGLVLTKQRAVPRKVSGGLSASGLLLWGFPLAGLTALGLPTNVSDALRHLKG